MPEASRSYNSSLMRRYLIVLAAFVLLALAGAASLSTVRAPDVPAYRVTEGRERAEPASLPGNTAPEHILAQTQAPAPDADSEPPEPAEGWVLQGRVELVPHCGVDIQSALSFRDQHIRIFALDLVDVGSMLLRIPASLDSQGNFSVACTDARLVPASSGFLLDPGMADEPDNALTRAAQSNPRPARESLTGLHVPKLRGRRVDFGVVRVDLFASAKAPWLLTGRTVHASGAPVTSDMQTWPFEMQYKSPGAAWTDCWDTFLQPGHDGRFAGLAAAETTFEPAGAWRLVLRVNDDVVHTILRPPSVDGRRLDFGVITLGGTLLEVRAEINGTADATYRGNPFLFGIEDDEPHVRLSLEMFRDFQTFIVPLAPWVSRIILPEGHYRFEAELYHPRLYAEDNSGPLDVPAGRRTELLLKFDAVSSIPVRALDPDGTDIECHLRWEIRREGEPSSHDTWSGSNWQRGMSAPVAPGCVTYVCADTSLYDSVEATARPGDAELVLRFRSTREGVRRLEVVIPRVSMERWTLDSSAHVMVSLGDDVDECTAHKGADLSFTGDAVCIFDLERPGAVEIWAEGGEWLGYPGGRMTHSVRTSPPEQGPWRVTLPPLWPAPWSVHASGLRARVTCGGAPVGLTARFAANRWTSTMTVQDGEKIDLSRWYSGEADDRVMRLPESLLDNGREIPLRATHPAKPDFEATLPIALRPRAYVTLTLGGTRIMKFKAALKTPGPMASACECETADGMAKLWVPFGPASLTIVVGGREIDLHDEFSTVTVPERAHVDVDVVLALASVEFPAPEGAVETDGDPWQMRLADDTKAAGRTVQWGDVVFVLPGRYRFVPLPPQDAAAAFEVDVKGRTKVDLPALARIATTSVLLRLTPAQVINLEDCEIEYFVTTSDDSTATAYAFTETRREAKVALHAQGLMVSDLPAGKAVAIRGVLRWNEYREGGSQSQLRPLVVQVKKDAVFQAEEQEITNDWMETGSALLAVVSDLPGHMLPLRVGDAGLRPGRHQIVVFNQERIEQFRTWIEVPRGVEAFSTPPELKAKLQEKGLLPKDEEAQD